MTPRSAPSSTFLISRIFLPFALGYYLSYLMRTVNAVISPDLTRELGLGAADLGCSPAPISLPSAWPRSRSASPSTATARAGSRRPCC
jgi:hypothetical protein